MCLINHANFLLDQQIAALEKAFVEGGGYSEQLAAARLAERERRKQEPSDRSDPPDRIPSCPQCGKPMALRTAKTGKNAGKQFWGCTAVSAWGVAGQRQPRALGRERVDSMHRGFLGLCTLLNRYQGDEGALAEPDRPLGRLPGGLVSGRRGDYAVLHDWAKSAAMRPARGRCR